MRIFNLIFMVILLAGCTTAPAQTRVPTSAPTTPPPVATPTSTDTFEYFAWVNKPEPKLGEWVTVNGSLIKNGAYLGSIPMWAFWPEEDGAHGVNSCVSQMAYQRGICGILVKGYPVDEYVPVTIRWEFDGRVFTTETGFTPRAK